MIFIYTTCKDTTEAQKLSEMLVQRKLASCVNIWPIGSIYAGEDGLKEEKEAAMLIKTIEMKLQQIEDFLSENHSYSIPCIATFDVRRINRPYKEWMSKTIE